MMGSLILPDALALQRFNPGGEVLSIVPIQMCGMFIWRERRVERTARGPQVPKVSSALAASLTGGHRIDAP